MYCEGLGSIMNSTVRSIGTSGMLTDFVNSSVEDTNPSEDTSIVCTDSVLVRTAFDMSLPTNLYLFFLNSFDAIMFN